MGGRSLQLLLEQGICPVAYGVKKGKPPCPRPEYLLGCCLPDVGSGMLPQACRATHGTRPQKSLSLLPKRQSITVPSGAASGQGCPSILNTSCYSGHFISGPCHQAPKAPLYSEMELCF